MLTVYTKNNCGFCVMLKNLLTKKGYDFTEVNIEEDEDAYTFVIEEGHKSMPQIYEDGSVFVEGGFEGMRAYLAEQEINNTNLGTL